MEVGCDGGAGGSGAMGSWVGALLDGMAGTSGSL